MKKIHRFLIQNISNNETFSIEDSEILHLINNVLKMKVGEEFIVFSSGSDDNIVEIINISKKELVVKKVGTKPKIIVPRSITVLLSITKRDTFEIAVQKMTEVGVSRIIPIISDRTVKQNLNIERLQKISDEALEQSGGSQRVMIDEPILLEKALEKCNKPVFYFDTDAYKYFPISESKFSIAIGPEGGWSDEDKMLFEKHGAKSLKLSSTVLRAETAGIVASYISIWN